VGHWVGDEAGEERSPFWGSEEEESHLDRLPAVAERETPVKSRLAGNHVIGGAHEVRAVGRELEDALVGSKNGQRRLATRRRSQWWMVKKWTTASGLLSEDGGSRRCST
jgi:hypothetical protein